MIVDEDKGSPFGQLIKSLKDQGMPLTRHERTDIERLNGHHFLQSLGDREGANPRIDLQNKQTACAQFSAAAKKSEPTNTEPQRQTEGQHTGIEQREGRPAVDGIAVLGITGKAR